MKNGLLCQDLIVSSIDKKFTKNSLFLAFKIAHMTKSEMGFMDSSYIGPGLLFLNQYFNTILNEYIVLWMCFVSISFFSSNFIFS